MTTSMDLSSSSSLTVSASDVAEVSNRSMKEVFAAIDDQQDAIADAEKALELAKAKLSYLGAELANVTDTRKFRRHGTVLTLVGRENKKTGTTTWFFKGEGNKAVLDLDA